jgi:hypothetical protein
MRHTSARTGRIKKVGTTSGFVHSHELKNIYPILYPIMHIAVSIAFLYVSNGMEDSAPAW